MFKSENLKPPFNNNKGVLNFIEDIILNFYLIKLIKRLNNWVLSLPDF